MIDRAYCQDQVTRLSGLPGYPKTDEGKRGLIDAAATFPTEPALRRWIDDALRGLDRCPLPRDLYRGASAAAPAKTRAAIRCFVCYDTGTTYADFLVTWRGGKYSCQRLTAEQAAELRRKDQEAVRRGDWGAVFAAGKQEIHEYPVTCLCRIDSPPLPPAPEERERYV